MTYTVVNGYSPRTYETILTECVSAVNEQFGTAYTNEEFEGTNLWKFLYATIQGMMTIENGIAELGAKMQDYIRTQNEELIIHRSSVDGFIQAMADELKLIASIKPIETGEEAGNISIAVDIDENGSDYAEKKQLIFNTMHKYLTAGLFYNGTEQGTVTATNGQQFNYAYDLPTKTPLKVRIKVRVSENKNIFVETPNEIKEKFLNNFEKLYRMGFDFEPQAFLCIDRDLPFASEITITYSTDGGTEYTEEILQGMYDEKITINPDEIEVEVL